MSKQKWLQILVGVLAFLGFVVSLAPYLTVLPAKYQPIGIALIGGAVGLEKFLITINQILVGPTKLQNAAVQTALAELPDKSTAGEDSAPPAAGSPGSPSSIDTSKPISSMKQP